jgi:hypothetical protein
VEYFNNLGNLTRNDAILYEKMYLGFPCKISIQQEGAFCSTLDLNCKDEGSKEMHLGHSFCCAENGHLGKYVGHTYVERLKCGAGEGWRSVGQIL